MRQILLNRKYILCIAAILLIFGFVALQICERAITGHIPTGYIVYVRYTMKMDSENGIYRVDPQGDKIESLTPFTSTNKFAVGGPTYSATNNNLAFDAYVNRRRGYVYTIANPSRGGEQPLSILFDIDRLPASINQLCWTSDGKRLVFWGFSKDDKLTEMICTSSLAGNASCWPVSTLLKPGEEMGRPGIAIDVSPQEDRLALSIEVRAQGGESKYHVYLTDLNGQNSVFLVEGENPKWSPDGELLLFAQITDLCVIQKDGSHFYCPYDGPQDPQNYIYTPNAEKRPGISREADWSPDGRFIVFTGGFSMVQNSRIYVLDIETGEVKNILSSDDSYFQYLEWIP